MKTIYFIDEARSSRVNGIGTFRRSFIHCLQRMDVNIGVISFNDEAAELEIERRGKITTYRIPAFPEGGPSTHPQVTNRLMKLYIADSADNVFCFNHSPCDKLLTMVRQSFPLSKIVFTIHDMGWSMALDGDEQKFRKIMADRHKRSVRKKYSHILANVKSDLTTFSTADRIVCLSTSTRNVLTEIYGVAESKIALIPNGMAQQVAENESKYKFSEDEKILICAGRLTRAKGVFALLKAFIEVLRRHPKTRLVLVGSANKYWDELFSLMGGIWANVTVTGHVAKEELTALYRAADIGVMPSLSEQCTYVGMEMMMHGLPVVASDANGVRDIFPDGECSLTAHIGNREDENEYAANLTNAICTLLENDELRQRLAKNAKARFDANYDISIIKDQYSKLFGRTENQNGE